MWGSTQLGKFSCLPHPRVLIKCPLNLTQKLPLTSLGNESGLRWMILSYLDKAKIKRGTKQNIWKCSSAVRGAALLGSSDPAPKEVNGKGCSLLPCSGLCCHITEAPLLFPPLTTYTACIRTVHCFHFLSALGWLKMHNYHQFAALLWKVPKLSLWRKLCHCLRHAFAVPCPWYLYPPFPKWNISPLFCFTEKWVVCLFLWFVLDCFWRSRKGKKKRRKLVV